MLRGKKLFTITNNNHKRVFNITDIKMKQLFEMNNQMNHLLAVATEVKNQNMLLKRDLGSMNYKALTLRCQCAELVVKEFTSKQTMISMKTTVSGFKQFVQMFKYKNKQLAIKIKVKQGNQNYYITLMVC